MIGLRAGARPLGAHAKWEVRRHRGGSGHDSLAEQKRASKDGGSQWRLNQKEEDMFSGLGQLTLLGLFGGALFVGDPPERISAVEVQHIRPTKPERQVELSNLSYFFATKSLVQDRLDLRLGAAASRARGSIVQLRGSFDEGTLRSETLDSPAWGIGPTVSASLKLLEARPVRLNLDASGSLMAYDRGFPAGGSWYNGMVQAGPSLNVGLGPNRNLTVGARWTHISNGQGLGAHNPSHDGRGVFLRYERALGRGATGRVVSDAVRGA